MSNPTNRGPGLSTMSGFGGNVFTSVLGDQNYGQSARGQTAATAKPLGL